MTQFSAYLIGNETLTRHCGEDMLERGHRIVAVVTRSADVRQWARVRGLRIENYGPDLAARLCEKVDWLLSIANLSLISTEVLALARGAVNFHDGPLPRYAGLNAPVWAILNGEVQHGISWHLIEGGIDEGDVLEHRSFEIAAQDTALTLNTRCFEAAMESFPSLLGQLESDLLQRKPQDLTRRSLFLRSDRPLAMGRIDFASPAEVVARLVRALDHGRYWNPLTTAKIACADRVLNVGAAELVAGSGVPGQVLQADDAGLVVACGTGAVRLTRLSCQEYGIAVSGATVTDTLLLGETEGLTELGQVLASTEPEMRKALKSLKPAALGQGSTAAADWKNLPLSGSLADLALAAALAVGAGDVDLTLAAHGVAGYVSAWRPLRVRSSVSIGTARGDLDIASKPGFALDLLTRDVSLSGLQCPQIGLAEIGPITGTAVTLTPTALHFDAKRLTVAEAQTFAARIVHLVDALAKADADAPLASIATLTEAERAKVLHGWNQTKTPYDSATCVHQAFEAQVLRSPDAVALICNEQSLTYAALNAKANQVAHVLMSMGVVPGTLVGLCAHRSLDVMVGALAIQKAGGAYVPMDPAYPADRIALYIEDSACPVIVTQSDIAAQLPAHNAQVFCLDSDARPALARSANPISGVTSADLAYMVYTSGSTGRPKGVMVEHRNVANFFTGMDQRVGPDVGVWLAVTSLSFDISVLELFWTLARGFKVVLTSDENRALVSGGAITSAQKMDFSLYYWGNDDGVGPKKYELLLEGAKFADTHGFCAVWTPERHFHAFGGPYPNPSVTGAAVAAVTQNISVRAGSCVMPLHHPARIAEEWAVIDNLTNGRAGMAVASGWHPDDFVLRPENTPPNNKAAMFAAADQVRRLWRGEKVAFPTGDGGSFELLSQPRPVSKELQLWVTTAGNPETWREAGKIGANVLTHLLGQSVDEVEGKIKLYHQALRDAGHDPADHVVTLMLHSYVAPDREQAREIARGPMKDYLRSAAALIKQYAWAFPAFKKPQGVSDPMQIDLQSLSSDETEAILDFAFQRYFEESGLFGTIEDALARVEQLKRIGVGEVACLIDFGIAPDLVMQGLRPLAEVLKRANSGKITEDDFSIAAQILRHGVSHLQCTPSMARMIAMNEDSRLALAEVKTVMLGGEALSGALVNDLRSATQARILNMYGPTETTIWSSVEEVSEVEGVCNIGKPLANQQIYVLDEAMQPVAPGVAGELWIGGDGVTRGYWQRNDLTAERFVNDSFVTPDRACAWGARMYRTGDLVRWRSDGKLDFLGRTDHQVKLRGYRIELGEIESVLEAQPGISQAVVMAREDTPGDVRLVAYIAGTSPETALRAGLAGKLPEHMMPAHFIRLDAFPLTPNRKVDRNALPAPDRKPAAQNFVATSSNIESQIAAIWERVLGVSKVGSKDNFFALGGHSLLAVQVHREIRDNLGAAKLSITDIFRFPVLSALAAHLDERPKAAPQIVSDRAGARMDAMARRRAMRAGQIA
ncbi:MAG: peptide synthetase [Cypionkella sp.]|uniref:MupA/Atu3671 family FMN-dependent luciferase-like monooxygenase n=1 Tax=Cypionkella sp. TaxID=2811411 RepID=UPI00262696D6|nr:MupA/Atu3671 family FMN-dependent luciferase-like monooxygenase [Cypionkella sp.]MDB5658716.1 peptide synthetase [Cypionkella sp.]